MIRYVVVSLVSGVLFGVLDGLIHANPLASRLYEAYRPLARTSINPVLGIVIDLTYGFVLAGLFLLLYESLPGGTPILKGLAFALITWFLRVVMYVASQWIMFEVPAPTLLYTLGTGLAEMTAIGLLLSLALRPGT